MVGRHSCDECYQLDRWDADALLSTDPAPPYLLWSLVLLSSKPPWSALSCDPKDSCGCSVLFLQYRSLRFLSLITYQNTIMVSSIEIPPPKIQSVWIVVLGNVEKFGLLSVSFLDC